MQIWNPTATVTRPADTTAYASGDLVANSTTAGSVVPMTLRLGYTGPQGQTRFTRIRLSKTGTSITNSAFRVHLYDGAAGTMTFANGDNGALSNDKAAFYLGNIDIAAMFAHTDGAAGFGAAPAGSEIMFKGSTGAGTILAVMEARGAYTPTSGEVYTLTIEDLGSY